MKSFIKINPSDNVAVALVPLAKGTVVKLDDITLTLTEDIMQGHKFSLKNLKPGDSIIKYGNPIGHATAEIPAGSWIHTHNLKTGLGDLLTYTYNKNVSDLPQKERIKEPNLYKNTLHGHLTLQILELTAINPYI